MKYIIHEKNGFPQPVIFSKTVMHSDMAQYLRLSSGDIISAGFVQFVSKLQCYGESISLDVKSRPTEDTELVMRELS